MARNDVYLNINALSPADAVVTGQQDMTAATVPELVLGDTPTFNFLFTDNTNVWPSWAGNASYTLTWALSDAVAGDFAPAATTGNATPITGGWSVILPLNSYELVGLLNTKRVGQPYPVTNLWQQLRVTDPSGNEVTRAMFWTPVRYRAISDTQNTESASPTGGRFVTVNNVNTLTTPTAAQFYAANPVPTSALGTAANGELLIGNGTGFTKATLTAGSGVSITNGSGSITISATDGDITLDDGTAAAPSLKFTADTDTGIYRPSDNVVGISAGGVSRATFGATSAINGTTIPGSKTLVVTTDKLSALAATTSAELAGVISDETGSGALVFATSPTLTTPILGTPQSGTLSSCTGLPISTGVSGLGTNVATFLATPSSANLASAVTDETGTGALVFANTPTLVTPNIGAATGTSVNLSGAGTFGGNLTVSGTGTIANELTVYNSVGIGIGNITEVATNGVATLYANYNGYQQSNTQFRNFAVYDGKRAEIATFTGSTKAVNFAGNLTVSGTGQSSVGGYLSINSALAGSTYGRLISGTTTAGLPAFFATNAVNASLVIDFPSSFVARIKTNSASEVLAFGIGATERARFETTGNLLIGTTTDGGQKLQVNGTALLGTDNASLGAYFDYNGGISGNATLWLKQTTKSSSTYTLTGGGTYTALNAPSGGSIYLRINNSDALTLDSSQRAQFAGNIGLAAAPLANIGIRNSLSLTASGGSAYVYQSGGTLTTAANNDAIFGMAIDNGYSNTGSYTNVTAGHLLLNARSFSGLAFGYGLRIGNITGATSNYAIRTGSGIVSFEDTTASTSTTTGALVVSGGVGVAGAVNVGGAIAIGNTVQTAASVASTHKVTIVIGGVTYYLLATNV